MTAGRHPHPAVPGEASGGRSGPPGAAGILPRPRPRPPTAFPTAAGALALLARPRLELLCAGSELLSGQLNTHLPRLSLILAGRGLALCREATLPDDRADLCREIRSSLERSDVLFVCGGLGPTFDDVTREAAADALGLELEYHPAIFELIRARFERLGLRMPAENKRQALVLSGAEVLPNKAGTAPGQLLTLPPKAGSASRRPRTLVLLPGPYRELAPMLERLVLPRLKARYAPRSVTEHLSLHLAGIPESAADEKLSELVATACPDLSFTILSYPGQVDFHAYATASTSRQARAVLQVVRRKALAAVGRHVLWEGDAILEAEVGRVLTARRLTLAVAESCTGGMVASRLTDISGASAFFLGGIAAYDNGLKTDLLGVSPATLRRHGAISRECCAEMAEGVRSRTGCSLGLSVTGIAGPSGGTRSKPVGLVYIGVAGPGAKTAVHEMRLSGDRAFIRTRAATRGLQLILQSARDR